MPSLPWSERSLLRQQADSRGDVDAPSTPSSGTRRALARPGGKRVELACNRFCPAALPLRSGASVRRRTAPGHRCRRRGRLHGVRAGLRNGRLRRLGSVFGPERHDRDAGRIFGHSHPSRLDHRRQGQRRRGRRSGRHDRAERGCRAGGAVRPPRRAPDGAGAGLPGPAFAAARAGCCSTFRSCARTRSGACAGFHVCLGGRPRGDGDARSGAGARVRACIGACAGRVDRGRRLTRAGSGSRRAAPGDRGLRPGLDRSARSRSRRQVGASQRHPAGCGDDRAEAAGGPERGSVAARGCRRHHA